MKYANKLTHKELRELYQLFIGTDATIKELNITKDECSIALEGVIEFPEYDEEYLKDNPNATIITNDDYELNDFNVWVYHHSGYCTLDYRTWMYKRFGNDYARDYLLNYPDMKKKKK